MKYIKALVILFVAVWLVSAPFAARARPGSMLYQLNVQVNEPVWAWLHITQSGRSEVVEEQLAKRYVELEHAWKDKIDWQQDWVLRAEGITASRVADRLAGAVAANDYKSADTLASHALAITRAHKQVLTQLVATPGFGKTADDIAFLDRRMSVLSTLYDTTAQRFATAYTKTELVRGVDGKISIADAVISQAQQDLASFDTSLTDTQRTAFQETVRRAQALQRLAKDRLAQDSYVDSYRYANLAQGYAMEIEIVLTASQSFEIPITTAPVGAMPQ